MYVNISYDSDDKKLLSLCAALTDWFSWWKDAFFPVREDLEFYIRVCGLILIFRGLLHCEMKSVLS
jgi:hypothetical protein